ncbi:glycosyltransferase family 2 protein [Chitinophaga sedimenti]|uniref:glycosyltransferase family 2 protein n=1 Tax=Chitinophaga sedimenti TaxID=2033606 RepID=UPI002003BCF4|nr:glycosyltransferase family 2 protein [Chitinophaga sedimenti]MCK7558278.1 glycosyltransferase family 2 protein [Chitinophaga sedimenti]
MAFEHGFIIFVTLYPSNMKVSGFTFVRNAVKYDYPVVEAIRSILPLCDEVVVSVGDCNDGTELIQSINSPKIRIEHSVWDDSLKEGGRILAVETDKAYDKVDPATTWAIYIRADEVLHEEDYPAIRAAMEQYKYDLRVEGLLFKYRHFFGSYDYLGDSRTWYKNEIRIVRYNKDVRSYRDAQGFRKHDQKLHVKRVDATVSHYGWVKSPETQAMKVNNSGSLYYGNDTEKYEKRKVTGAFDYSIVDSVERFTGTHPKVMQERVNRINWEFEHDISLKKFGFKDRLLYWIEKQTGRRLFDYTNYKILR